MPTFGQGVRGIEDCRIAELDNTDTPGNNTDIVGIKGFTVESNADTDEQMGDDAVLFTVQENKTLTVGITAALANLEAFAVATGTTVTSSGTTPNVIHTWEVPGTASYPYVQITAQANARDTAGSAFRYTAFKGSLSTDPSFSLENGAWMEPEAEFTFIPVGGLLAVINAMETAVAIPTDGSEYLS